MRQDNQIIITGLPPAQAIRINRRLVFGVFFAVMAVGAAAAIYYADAGLTLSHYDARAHLVVARRVIDSLTPGWRQLGAVWLPLPHLLNVLPVQLDWAYRTGAIAVFLSILAMAMGLSSLAALLLRTTGSAAAALAGPALVLLNPNILYLTSTPMTEPLLIGLALVALNEVEKTPGVSWRPGAALAALVLTRYEGWCIAAALVAGAAWARRRDGWRPIAAIATAPAVAIAAFLIHARISTGTWFVASGFFTADNPARSDLRLTLDQVVMTTRALGGDVLVAAAALGAAVCVAAAARRGSAALLPLALVAAAALPLAAFYEGHPLRVRYMVPLVVAAAVLGARGLTIVPRRGRGLAAAALVALVLWAQPPLAAVAPMVQEAQWELPFRHAREPVTRYLGGAYDRRPILVSMGSLGHYLQELSSIGIEIRDVVHEGNGDLWAAALDSPARHVGWVLIEEHAEGGDMLATLAREDPAMLDGFTRVASGGGVVLYRRQ